MKCWLSQACPDLFEKEDGAFIAIGRKLDENETKELKITDKIAEDEVASELPREVVLNALKLSKWNGGFEGARKIAWNILDTCRGPRGLNDFDNMAFIEKLSEALVEAYDSGVAAEYRTRQSSPEADKIDRLKVVTACLLDHYLDAYNGNMDRLSSEAQKLIPDWKEKCNEWRPRDKSNESD